MKNIGYLLFFVIILTACSDKEEVVGPLSDGLEVFCPDFELGYVEDFASTRSSLSWDVDESNKTVIRFAWKDGDKLKIFSDDEKGVSSNLYTLRVVEKDGNTAYFNGGGFSLNKGCVYYAFSPASVIHDEKESFDKGNIVVSYEGQTQVENDNCNHLGRYDYQVACSKVSDDGVAQLGFKHLGTVARVRFSQVPGKKFKRFELVSSDNYEFQYERKLDLTDEGADVGDWGPSLGLVRDPNYSGNNSFVLNLTDESHDGIVVPEASAENPTPRLVLYMMLPASEELNGKQLYGIITECEKNSSGEYIEDDGIDDNNDKYYIALAGKTYGAGKYIAYGDKAASSDKLNISLTIDKDWQIGNVKDITRASNTGDPGFDDQLIKPKHIYVYTCVDGKYFDTKKIASIPDEDWNEKWSYKDNIKIDLEGRPTNNVHIYVVASKEEITVNTTESLSKNTTSESVVAGMTMNMPSTFDKDILKNIYTYDYVLDYTKSNVNPIINATLYHACAKLDVQWNSTTALSGNVTIKSTSDSGLPTSGLKLFTPTENSGTGTWIPEQSITTGTMYNGRAVFYVPQFQTQKYYITVGGKSGDITFNAPCTDKKTSWFKANITQ